MESDDDLHPSSPSPEDPLPVPRKLKRLKRAIRVSHDPDLKQSDGGSVSPEANSSPFESQNSESNHLHSSLGSEDFSLKNVESFKESDWVLRSRSGSEDFDSENLMDFGYTGLGGEEGGSGAKRALDFGKVDEKREEEDGVRRNEVEGESHNEELDVSEKKRHSSDGIEEEQDKEEEKKNKKRRVDSGFDDRKLEKAAKNKRRAEKVCRGFEILLYLFFINLCGQNIIVYSYCLWLLLSFDVCNFTGKKRSSQAASFRISKTLARFKLFESQF